MMDSLNYFNMRSFFIVAFIKLSDYIAIISNFQANLDTLMGFIIILGCFSLTPQIFSDFISFNS